jgi:hypothetical protein
MYNIMINRGVNIEGGDAKRASGPLLSDGQATKS